MSRPTATLTVSPDNVVPTALVCPAESMVCVVLVERKPFSTWKCSSRTS